MSETKFTPGPWRLSSQSPRIIQKDCRDTGSDHGFLIASSMGRDDSGFYASESEADANAHLIAAAPELFEALDTLVSVVGLTAFKYAEQRAVLQEAADQSIAALAKARGES